MDPSVPVLRIFDERKAKEFYVDFLGFEINFEQRFGDNFPIYIGISQSNCELHLSEHHGDACPGAAIRVGIRGIEAFSSTLTAKAYKYSKPGAPERTPWGTKEFTITDPFGNRLTFAEKA
jgi:uncharacterized glyoxalase superfamily protein PhnB